MMLASLWRMLSDLLFPRTKEVRALEEMSVEAFLKQARRSDLKKNGTIALFEYRTPLLRSAIWQIKYHRNAKVSRLLANAAYDLLIEELADLKTFYHFETPLLIPIPLSDKRLKERGYNQIVELARHLEAAGVAAAFSLETGALLKIRHTSPQSEISDRKKRLKNLKGCFRVSDEAKVRGRNIILLDDVTTTGATFKEAAGALKRAGCLKVICIAIAH